jgi:predicted  nucleic acid-binding Zn-ribbon protein
LSTLKILFEESQKKVNELETKITAIEEKHTSDSSEASQGLKEQLDKIRQLEKDLSTSNNRQKQYQTTIGNIVSSKGNNSYLLPGYLHFEG